ncbi:MAG: radical SAM protein [Calditrichaceae bacterium]|nr:radical SAM protein [Calditrichaceae bacterium]
MKPKLLLINPWIYDFAAYDLWSKPLGLLYLASFLRLFGFEIAFIDCLDKYDTPGDNKISAKIKTDGRGKYKREIIARPAVLNDIPRHYARYGIGENLFREKIKVHQDASAVLVTSIMTYWYPGVKRAVEIIREELPGKPVILGGIYASLLPDHAQKHIDPDYLITGPGEFKLINLLTEKLEFSIDRSILPKHLDDHPYPAFDLITHPDYLVIMTSRGCPYNCSFCAQKLISMPYTRRNPEDVVEEFNAHYKIFGLRDFAFYDDALFINRDEHIKIILQGLIDARLPLRLHSPNGLFARAIDDELAGLMLRSGFKTIRLSFETSNEARRKDMYSKVSNDDMIRAVDLLVKAGYRAGELESYVLMGLPGQSLEEIIASVIFVHNLGVQVKLASFSPIPGTKEFDKAVEAGLIDKEIDPLLTNKTIYPLRNKGLSYETYRKVRSFTQVLNDAAKRSLKIFDDKEIGPAIKSVLRSADV